MSDAHAGHFEGEETASVVREGTAALGAAAFAAAGFFAAAFSCSFSHND